MSTLNYATDKQRFIEIQSQIKALNLEAERIILAYQKEDKPEGRGVHANTMFAHVRVMLKVITLQFVVGVAVVITLRIMLFSVKGFG